MRRAARKSVPSAQFEIGCGRQAAVVSRPTRSGDRGGGHLKRRYPQSDVTVKDFVNGQVVAVEHKPDLGPRIFPWV